MLCNTFDSSVVNFYFNYDQDYSFIALYPHKEIEQQSQLQLQEQGQQQPQQGHQEQHQQYSQSIRHPCADHFTSYPQLMKRAQLIPMQHHNLL